MWQLGNLIAGFCLGFTAAMVLGLYLDSDGRRK